MTPAALEMQLEQVRAIPLEQLDASSKNPRQTMDEAGLEELAASIREIGITNPLLVRPTYTEDEIEQAEKDGGFKSYPASYQIVCGHRRSEAATIAGLASVPCIVRAMDDATAEEIALIDNLQRVDVPAVEEAVAFNELLERLGSILAVAAKVGKEQSYVARRLRLCSLTVWSQDALRQKLITVDHALLLARLGEGEQNEALKWTIDPHAGVKTSVDKVIAARITQGKENANRYFGRVWEPQTVQKLKEHIEEHSGRKLARAPWPMDEDYLLPDAGSCLDCPNNTKANAPLFGDLAIDEATCADGACFEAKRIGWVNIQLRAAGADANAKPKRYVPQLSWKASSVKPATCFNDITAAGAMSTTADPSKVLRQGQWIEAKKGSCPNVRPGITADWSDKANRGFMGGDSKKLRKPGEQLSVCIAVGCKVHRKEWEKPKTESANSSGRVDPAEEQKRRQLQGHLEEVESEVRISVFKAILGKCDAARAVLMVASQDQDAPAIRKKLLAWFPKLSGLELEAFVLLWSGCERDLDPSGYFLMQPGGVERDRKELWSMAKSVGVDADAVAIRHFEDVGISPAAAVLMPKKAAKPAAKKAAKVPAKAAAKKAAKKPAKKAAKKGGRK